MINLLFADDSSLFLDGVIRILEDEPDMVIKARASNGLEVLEKLKNDDFDIVLLDINMPKLDGVKCARRIRKLGIDVKILVLSEFSDKELIDKLLNCSIDGYLKKDVDKEELLRAIKSVYGGKMYISKSVRSGDFIKKTPPSRYDYIQINFIGRQKQVLNLVRGGMTTSEIAKKLNISEHSVGKHRERIMYKSGVKTSAELGSWAEKHDFID